MGDAMVAGYPRGLLVKIDHPSGIGYFTTSVGKKTWDGQTWTGTGVLGTVTPIKQDSSISVQDIAFRMSGVDPDTVAKLSDDVHNRQAQAWLCCFDEAGNVVADPYQLLDCELDTQTLNIADDGTATIEITAHAGFYALDRAVEEAWTPENQHLNFPGDTGLDMIPSLVKQDLQWTPT